MALGSVGTSAQGDTDVGSPAVGVQVTCTVRPLVKGTGGTLSVGHVELSDRSCWMANSTPLSAAKTLLSWPATTALMLKLAPAFAKIAPRARERIVSRASTRMRADPSSDRRGSPCTSEPHHLATGEHADGRIGGDVG